MQGKDDEEEGAEVVKHLDEEVPRQPDVGLEVRDGQTRVPESVAKSAILAADAHSGPVAAFSGNEKETHMTPYTLERYDQLPVHHLLQASKAIWCAAKARTPCTAKVRRSGRG